MKIYLCAAAKNEAQYLGDWITYHLNIGFDKIIIGDNNSSVDNSQRDVIEKYDNVIYENIRSDGNYNQTRFYERMYLKYGEECDWMAFYDIDEFIAFDGKLWHNVHEFCEDPDFANVQQLYVNWKCYNDSGLLHYENKPVWERFHEVCDMNTHDPNYTVKSLKVNTHVKCFVRTKLGKPVFDDPHHMHLPKIELTTMNAVKERVSGVSPFTKTITWENAWLDHYITLTANEFFPRRLTQNRHQGKMDRWNKLYAQFFGYCQHTPEKDEIVERIKEDWLKDS